MKLFDVNDQLVPGILFHKGDRVQVIGKNTIGIVKSVEEDGLIIVVDWPDGAKLGSRWLVTNLELVDGDK